MFSVTMLIPFSFSFILWLAASDYFIFFFFKDPATPEFSPFPLHAALPISIVGQAEQNVRSGLNRLRGDFCASGEAGRTGTRRRQDRQKERSAILHDVFVQQPRPAARDRKSTRLNSSHLVISYAVFCLKKKK